MHKFGCVPSDTNKCARELIWSSRNTVRHPAAPGALTQAARMRIPSDAVTTKLRPPLVLWKQHFSLKVVRLPPYNVTISSNGGRSSVVRASEFKPKDPVFDPLKEQADGQFLYPFETTCVQICLCLTQVFCVRHALKLVRTLNIPYLSVVKELTPKPVVWSHTNTAVTRN